MEWRAIVSKELLAAAAIAFTIAMYLPYIRSIHTGRTKPNVISWLTWTLATLVVCLAQLAGDGGAGAWPIGIAGIFTAYIAILALARNRNAAITNTDWAFLSVAFIALPCWLLTSNALAAVLLITGVELAAFGPTFRSAYAQPHQERVNFYLLGAIRNGLAVAALEHYSWTTALFPAAKGVVGLALILMIVYRRSRLSALGGSG